MVTVLNKKVELEKDETFNHMLRCAKLAKDFGIYMGLTLDQQYILEVGAYLHDIGKFKIPRDILYKSNKLTHEEFELIKTHTTVVTYNFEKDIMDIIRQHHERVDGKGYPLGLKGEEINPIAKIMALIDVYDAITNKRVYKEKKTKEYAIEVIRNGKGTQFDLELADSFISFIMCKGEGV